MNINRHNYEEFFLLYVDNELTAAQRKIVEAFVAANPDLQEEFNLIQQSIFTADEKLDAGFITSLLKPVADETSVSEEQLLLYIDDELRAGEQKAVEQAIVNTPQLQKELQWLKRSIFEADKSIVFPDKSLLYKEAQPAGIIYLNSSVRRWAAAAAVIVLLGSALWLMLDQSTHPAKPLAYKPPVQTGKKTAADVKPVRQPVKEAQVTADDFTVAQANQNNHTAALAKTTASIKNSAARNDEQKIIPATVKEEPFVAKAEIPAANLPEKISSGTSNITETPTVPPVTNTAGTVSYASYNNDTNDEKENIFLTEERQRRSGLKSMVKKAKRMFERNTGIQSNASEVRFAVFAVNTQ